MVVQNQNISGGDGPETPETEAPNATVLDQAIQHSQDYFRGLSVQ